MSVRRPLAGLVILGPLLSACSTSATPPPSAGPTEAAPTPAPAPVAFTLKATVWWSGHVISVKHPDPPVDTTAWMFGRPLDITPDGTRDFVLTRSFGVVPGEPPNDPKGCLSTFVIGYVGFLIFGTNSRVDRTPHIGLTLWLEERTIRLWPTIAAAITWPPARVMSLSEVLPVARLGQPDPGVASLAERTSPTNTSKAVCDEAIRPQDHRHDGKVVFAVPVCGAATQDAAATVPRLTRRPLRQLLRRAKGGVLPRQIT